MDTEKLKTQVGYYMNQVNRNIGQPQVQADAINMAVRLAKWSAATPYGYVLAEYRMSDNGWNVYVMANGMAYNFSTNGERYSVSTGGPAFADRSDRTAWLAEINAQRRVLQDVIGYLSACGQTPNDLLESIRNSRDNLRSLTEEISA